MPFTGLYFTMQNMEQQGCNNLVCTLSFLSVIVFGILIIIFLLVGDKQ